ncbi:hypothetical protein [Streptomyces lancefieldiae]|uniref:Uncharacterized protein n=1 Tax=Streptomyces lancefieldiae TaxID=3075520 RepID=A0ABU3AUQ6_9ACTN|nr:hypothetical protein [Streptomyces sp. DSM 40712]MDT0613575.1 hypothetical protein [Streptomyces sp. DSM 40712]
MPDQPQVKYPFEFDRRWVLRYHVPYTVQYEGRPHRIVATVFAQPSVHGRIQVSCAGLPPVEYDGLTADDTVEITGDTWRVAEVDYRTRVVLERVTDVVEEETNAQAGR